MPVDSIQYGWDGIFIHKSPLKGEKNIQNLKYNNKYTICSLKAILPLLTFLNFLPHNFNLFLYSYILFTIQRIQQIFQHSWSSHIGDHVVEIFLEFILKFILIFKEKYWGSMLKYLEITPLEGKYFFTTIFSLESKQTHQVFLCFNQSFSLSYLYFILADKYKRHTIGNIFSIN